MISVLSCVRGRISVIYLRDDDFGAFMCERWDSGAFTWGMMISVHSCVRGGISVHLLEGWWFWCIHVWEVGYCCIYLRKDNLRCIHVWGVRFRCIYLRDDDFVFGVGYRCIYLRSDDWRYIHDSGAFTWGMMMSVHSCVRGRISVQSHERWWFRCIHVWGVRFRCIYLRDDDVGAFMCEG